MKELRARCGPTRIYHPSLYAFLIIGHEHNYSLSFLAIILKLASFFFAFGRRTGAVVVVGLGGEGRRWLISTHPPFGWESTFARTSPSMCLCDMRGEDEIFDFSPDENTFGRLESPAALSRPEDDPPHVRRIFNFDHFPAGGFLPGFKKDRLFQYFYVTYIEKGWGEVVRGEARVEYYATDHSSTHRPEIFPANRRRRWSTLENKSRNSFWVCCCWSGPRFTGKLTRFVGRNRKKNIIISPSPRSSFLPRRRGGGDCL